MSHISSLSNHFLIAMPNLEDPNFYHSVTYMCSHDDNGAMGVTINRPILDVTFNDLLEQLHMETDDPDIANIPIFAGGPVQPERGFVLHRNFGEWEASMEVAEDVSLTMSQDIIEAIALNNGPEKYLIMLGYAGWNDGQLEQELMMNSWLNGPADPDIIFEVSSDDKWTAAAHHLGVEMSLLSGDVGHA